MQETTKTKNTQKSHFTLLHKAASYAALLFIISSSLLPTSYATFTNNADAIDLIGQYTSSSLTDPEPLYTKGGVSDSPNSRGLKEPSGGVVDTVDHRLFISDTGNRRVLVYDLNPDNTLQDYTPDYVLGAPDFTTLGDYAQTSTTIIGPGDLAYDSVGKRLFVADNARVLIFDVTTIENGEAAVNVLGQTDFVSQVFDSALNRVGAPIALAYDEAGDRLFVATTTANNKIIVFDTSTIIDGEDPIHVLVHSTLNSTTDTPSATDTLNIYGLAYDSARELLFASDTLWNRVLVYDVSNIVDDAAAINVMGQPDFTSKTASASSTSTYQPKDLVLDNGRLFVAQPDYFRTTVFDVTTITDGEAAINVLGQENFTSTTTPPLLPSNIQPYRMFADGVGQRLYMSGFHGVRIFDITMVTDNEDPIDIIGQTIYDNPLSPVTSLIRRGENNSPDPYGLTPGHTAIDEQNHRLFVTDTKNSRVLVYNLNTDNRLQDHFPDYVLGQPNFNEVVSGTASLTSLSSPSSVVYDPTTNRLFVLDGGRSRIVVFDVATITNGEAAIHVLGQPDLSTSGFAFAATAENMQFVRSMLLDPVRQLLFVADGGFGRVQIFDVATIVDGEAAVNVLGQDTLNDSGGFGPTTSSSIGSPEGMAYDRENTMLFVADGFAHRVLAFDIDTITDGESAVHVLGQSDFTSSATAATKSSTPSPKGLAYDEVGKRLFVSQGGAHRVTVFDMQTIQDGEASIGVLGQADFTSQDSGLSASDFKNPGQLSYASTTDELYIADSGNHRLLVFDVLPPVPALIIEETGGATAVTEGGAEHTDTFTVRLSAYADADVVVNVVSDSSSVSVDIPTLTFTPATWDVPQVITVRAVDDTNTVSENPTITLSVDELSDVTYTGLVPSVVDVTVTDTTVVVAPDPTPVSPPIVSGGGGGGIGYVPPVQVPDQSEEDTGTDNDNDIDDVLDITVPPVHGSAGNPNYRPLYEYGSAKQFADLEGHWSYDAVDTLSRYCDIMGYPEGEITDFRPNQEMLRGEFISLVLRCLGKGTAEPQYIFGDVDTSSWYAGYIQKAYELGWVQGYADGTFRPGVVMTREEAAKVLMTAVATIGFSSENPFQDVSEDAWYAPYIDVAYVRGIMTGYKDEQGELLYRFGVGEAILRGELAQALAGVLTESKSK